MKCRGLAPGVFQQAQRAQPPRNLRGLLNPTQEAWANERHCRAEKTRAAMPRLPPQSCRTGHNFNPSGEGPSARAAAWEVRMQKQQHMEQGRQVQVTPNCLVVMLGLAKWVEASLACIV